MFGPLEQFEIIYSFFDYFKIQTNFVISEQILFPYGYQIIGFILAWKNCLDSWRETFLQVIDINLKYILNGYTNTYIPPFSPTFCITYTAFWPVIFNWLINYQFLGKIQNQQSWLEYYFFFFDFFYIFFFNNFFLMIIIIFFIFIFFIYQLFFQYTIIPKIWLYVFQQYCSIIQKIINDLLIHFNGKFYLFSLLFVLFILINILNVFGLIPYSFAITSYFSVTFFFAFIFFFSFLFIGIFYHGISLLNLFLPSGTPLVIMPLLILIEFISYFARVFSLSIRLFANITAGHILLKILSWFLFLLIHVLIISISGFFLISCLWVLEFFISILQAYVFLILLCIYLNEVLSLQH